MTAITRLAVTAAGPVAGRAAVAAYVDGTEGRLMRSMRSMREALRRGKG